MTPRIDMTTLYESFKNIVWNSEFLQPWNVRYNNNRDSLCGLHAQLDQTLQFHLVMNLFVDSLILGRQSLRTWSETVDEIPFQPIV